MLDIPFNIRLPGAHSVTDGGSRHPSPAPLDTLIETRPASILLLAALTLVVASGAIAQPSAGGSGDEDEIEGKRGRRIVITIDPDDTDLPEDAEDLEDLEDPDGTFIERDADHLRLEDLPDARLPDFGEDVEHLERELDRAKRELDRAERSMRGTQTRIRFDVDGDGRELVRFGRSLFIDEDDVVSKAVVIGGDLDVEGEIEGDALVIAGDLRVRRDSYVGGSAVVIGGELDIDPGAYVDGDRVEVGAFNLFGLPVVITRGGGLGTRVVKLFTSFLGLLLALLLAWVATLVIGDRLAVMSSVVRTEMLRSFLIGLLVFMLWVPAMILCVVILIGIPITLILAVAVPLAAFIGFLAGARVLGERVAGSVRFERQGDLGHLLVGVALIAVLPLVGTALRLIGGPLMPIAIGFKAAGYILSVLAATVGLGALVTSRFGRPRALVSVESPTPPGGGPVQVAGVGPE